MVPSIPSLLTADSPFDQHILSLQGPDYDSNDETEMALETARLHSLLKDWETASSSSLSLPSTPRHNPRSHGHATERSAHSAPKPHSRIPQNVIHQQYGVSPAPGPYRQPPQTYVPAYQNYGPYQEYSQPYAPHQNYSIPRQYSTHQHIQQHNTSSIQHQNVPNIVNQIPNMSNAASAITVAYQPTNSPKQHHKYPQIPGTVLPAANLNYQTATVSMGSSPSHKMYVAPSQAQLQSQIQSQMQSQTASPSQNLQNYTNGELLIQQQLYNQQMQYQQSREYQQYRLNREQLLVQQQICATQGAYGVIPPQQTRGSHYQSSVHVPIVAVLPQGDQSPKMMQRKQPRQYSQEMT